MYTYLSLSLYIYIHTYTCTCTYLSLSRVGAGLSWAEPCAWILFFVGTLFPYNVFSEIIHKK